MLDFSAQREQQRQQHLQEQQRKRITKTRARLLPAHQRRQRGAGGGRQQERSSSGGGGGAAREGGPDAEFLVDDWESGGEGDASAEAQCGGGAAAASDADGRASKRSPGTARLALSSSGSESSEEGGVALGEAAERVPTKQQVIFASRTHSQLSQFVGELLRTQFGDDMSLVALGSRKVGAGLGPGPPENCPNAAFDSQARGGWRVVGGDRLATGRVGCLLPARHTTASLPQPTHPTAGSVHQ